MGVLNESILFDYIKTPCHHLPLAFLSSGGFSSDSELVVAIIVPELASRDERK